MTLTNLFPAWLSCLSKVPGLNQPSLLFVISLVLLTEIKLAVSHHFHLKKQSHLRSLQVLLLLAYDSVRAGQVNDCVTGNLYIIAHQLELFLIYKYDFTKSCIYIQAYHIQ